VVNSPATLATRLQQIAIRCAHDRQVDGRGGSRGHGQRFPKTKPLKNFTLNHLSVEDRAERLSPLMRPFDRSRPSHRLGRLRRFAVMGVAATRAYDLGIVIGHFVQEGGKRLTTVRA
jgi:hypothetical protein